MGAQCHSVWNDDCGRETVVNAADTKITRLYHELAGVACGQGRGIVDPGKISSLLSTDVAISRMKIHERGPGVSKPPGHPLPVYRPVFSLHASSRIGRATHGPANNTSRSPGCALANAN